MIYIYIHILGINNIYIYILYEFGSCQTGVRQLPNPSFAAVRPWFGICQTRVWQLPSSGLTAYSGANDADDEDDADAGVRALHPGGDFCLASDSDMEEAAEGMYDDDGGGCCFSDAPSEAPSNATSPDQLSFSSVDSDAHATPTFDRGSAAPEPSQGDPQILSRWPALLLQALVLVLTVGELHRSLLVFPNLLLTSHFTGIGTAEVAVQMLSSAVNDAVGCNLAWNFLYCYEKDPTCRQILLQRPGLGCIFGDIAEYSRGLLQLMKQKTLDPDEAWEQLQHDFALRGGFCHQHQQTCNHVAGHCDISGSPCQPWSRIGKRRGRHDVRFALTLCWILWVLTARPWVAIHENVVGFDRNIFVERLGAFYGIIHIIVRPADMGYRFTSRPRLFTVLWLKASVAMVHDISATYDRVSQAVRKWQPVLSLSSIYTRDQQLLLQVENMFRAKRHLPCLAAASSDWTCLLGESETKFLGTYLAMWKAVTGKEAHTDKNCLFNLGQNPNLRRCWTNRRGAMPTMTAASRKLWSPYLRRWLIPSEIASAMGFNTGTSAQTGVPVDPAAALYSYKCLGNAMNVASVGGVFACALACLHPIDPGGS